MLPPAVVVVLVEATQRRQGTETDGVGEENLSASVDPHLEISTPGVGFSKGTRIKVKIFDFTNQSEHCYLLRILTLSQT